jgi:hypothetical protein
MRGSGGVDPRWPLVAKETRAIKDFVAGEIGKYRLETTA